MKIGFTGTRDGLDAPQGGALARFIQATPMDQFHHGCCLGADTEAVTHVEHYRPEAITFAHPCDLERFVSRVAQAASDVTLEVKQPLDRNRDIVDDCDILLACPKGPEERRSGTWYTVRYARKQGKRIVIFWPDGEVTEEGPAVTPEPDALARGVACS